MGEALVAAGLSRHVAVFDLAAIAPLASDDDECLDPDPASDAGTECEIGGYVVRALRTDAWESIVSVLASLSAEDPDLFHAMMRGCRAVSDSTPEIDGLDDLLHGPDQLLHDVALDRDDRRARLGYSTAADARAFLQMAREGRRGESEGQAQNPIAAAYCRAMEDAPASGEVAAGQLEAGTTSSAHLDEADGLAAVAELLTESGLGSRPFALLEDAHPANQRLGRMRRLLAYVHDHDEAAFMARVSELAFLVNTIAAGCSIQSRALTPEEAAEAAISTCNLGLELWPERWPDPSAPAGRRQQPDHFLGAHDLVTAFDVGWKALHHDVGRHTAECVAAALEALQFDDRAIQDDVDALRFELRRQREAGTPWQARRALEVIGTIDATTWIGVSGLLDQCPVIAAALTATLEGRTGPVSAMAFEFISTPRQLDLIRKFLERLPALLAP